MTEPALILCCEDEPHLLRDISEELQQAGYRVAEARTGAEVLACLETCTPDLVLCDIMMPEVDGYGVLTRLRRDHPHLAHVPLVFLSALSMTEAIIRGKRAGADDYLTKPINYDLLLTTIEARLRQRTQARAGLAHVAGLGQHLMRSLAIGMMTFDPEGKILAANVTADQILADHGAEVWGALADPVRRAGITARAGREDVQSLSLALGADGSDLCLMQFHACPADAAKGTPAMVIVFLSTPNSQAPLSAEALSAMFGLTPTEACVARHLASGLRPDQIASALGVAATTIAFHLRNVFAKTETHRQADLVALLLALPLRDPA